ncbi:magnesium transporter CorA family protein [Dehalogenimonas alkenigignens]|uniref:Mg2+ and Co2+ transporter n=1 Tax=Dehalogenimonas alkenigignens TaxID=1217799 RepID=A0A0W0GHF4_9CHLR|nr:magnesium transporter CorA family protein [Dehalogenimonas alkenigignens]KTB47994.1 Mg2+ and Co2+ transporter [Dehalogenimonas alkenigignens]
MAVVQNSKIPKLRMESVEFGGLVWYDVERPTEVETLHLSQNFSFHPLDLDDVLSKRQRPKIDEYKDYLFFVFHFPAYNKLERLLMPSQLSVFIGQGFLITLHAGNLKPLMKLFRECELDEESRKEYMRHGPGYLLYRIVDRLVDYCQPIVNKILDSMDSIEDEIFARRRRSGTVRDISILRRDIITFRRTVWPMRAVIAGLEPKIKRYIDTDLNVYFGDLIDHTDKLWDSLDECKEIIEGLSSTFDSMSINNYNEGIRILTIFATISLPSLLVASIYGMNIDLPFQHNDHTIIIVGLLTLAATAITAVVLRWLKII